MLILERDRVSPSPIERQMFEFNVNSYLPNYETFMRLSTPWIAAREKAMTERVGATYLDLTGVFKTVEGQVYTDYCHLTPHGNEVVAAAIEQTITPMIQSRIAAHARAAAPASTNSANEARR
jgi:hypothetical protein